MPAGCYGLLRPDMVKFGVIAISLMFQLGILQLIDTGKIAILNVFVSSCKSVDVMTSAVSFPDLYSRAIST